MAIENGDSNAGLGVDRYGSPVVDPTKNVLQLVEAAVKRSDDLAAAEARRVDEVSRLRAEYQEKLALAEAKRIDAIRAVDVNAVAVASERAAAQAAVLANQLTASAETARALVASTAVTIAQQLATLSAQFNDRMSALEKSQNDRITALEKSQYEIRGTGAGRKDFYGWIIGGAITLAALVTLVLRFSGK